MLGENFDSISKKMMIDFEQITSQINHNGEKGTARENILVEYLKGYIPQKFSLSKGTIIDWEDTQSRQVDIIIHDTYNSPILLDMDSTKIIPIESVYGIIEVKSTLSKAELNKSIENIKSVRRLSKHTINNISCPTIGMIFAFTSDASIEAVYKNFIELNKNVDFENQVSCICILDKGVILPVNKKGMLDISLFPSNNTAFTIIQNDKNSLLLFYLFLIQALNQIVIFPPDMVSYVAKSGLLNTTFTIPSEYIQDDIEVNLGKEFIAISKIKNMQLFQKRFSTGKFNSDEIMEYLLNVFIPMYQSCYGNLDVSNNKEQVTFLDTKIDVVKMIEMCKIHQAIINKQDINEEDTKRYLEFKNEIYLIYKTRVSNK